MMRKASMDKTWYDILDRRDRHHLMTLRTEGKERDIHQKAKDILDDTAFRIDELRSGLRED